MSAHEHGDCQKAVDGCVESLLIGYGRLLCKNQGFFTTRQALARTYGKPNDLPHSRTQIVCKF